MNKYVVQDYILLIMNCEKYREKALKQKETWLPQLPSHIIYFHVIGDPTMKVPFLFDLIERVLYVNTEDDYNSLPKKVISAYDAVYKTYQFKYIFKTDDDQHLLNTQFFNILTNLLEDSNQRVHYGGKIMDVNIPYLCGYHKIHPELPENLIIQATQYCNGRFYLLSHDSIMYLTTKKDKIQREYIEDYAIGYYLPPFLKRIILKINTDKHFVDFE